MQKFRESLASAATRAAISGASITVYVAGTTTPATLYSDNGVTLLANPVTSDSTGSFEFYAADGRYDLMISGSSFSTFWIRDILLEDPASANPIVASSISMGGVTVDAISKMGSLVLLAAKEASNSAQIDFTEFSSSFDIHLLMISKMVPQTSGAGLRMRYSTDGGATYVSTGSYNYYHQQRAAVGAVGFGGASQTYMELAANVAVSGLHGSVRFSHLNLASLAKLYRADLTYITAATDEVMDDGIGRFSIGSSAVNGIRLLMSSGNIASGSFALYGLRKA